MPLLKYPRPHFFPLALLLSLLLSFAGSAQAKEYPDPKIWDATIYGFNLEDDIDGVKIGGVVATGSSSMRFWDSRIHQDLAPLTVTSRGFGGSNMNDVLHHLETLVLKHKPRAVLIYEGDNDVAQGVPVDVIIDTFKKTLASIHSALPKTRIYLVSIKPSISRAQMWDDMQAVNRAMSDMAKNDTRVTYLDVASPMFDAEGNMRADIYVPDQLHLNQRGYDIWNNAISPVVLTNEVVFEFPITTTH